MSVKTNIPQLAALKADVERVAGEAFNTHNAFLHLVDMIESSLSEHMSESTLERLWGYSTRSSDSVSLRTLDVLSRFAGAASWQDYCERLKEISQVESEEIYERGVESSSLRIGIRIRLGWLPDRLVVIQYEGDRRFVVVESLNSSLRPGDSFECLTLQKGRELYLDRFMRCGSSESARYVVGQKSGLTTLEIIG